MKKIYRVLGFVNGYNKKTKQWEQIFHTETIYKGKEGLKTAHQDFKRELENVKFACSQHDSKYSDTRGKIELHEPHFHDNGQMSYWGDKIHQFSNPYNI